MRDLYSLFLTCLFAVSSLFTAASVDLFSDGRIDHPSTYENSGLFAMSTCTATFVNEGNANRVLWRFIADDWDNNTTINSGESVTKSVSDGEIWQIWSTDDETLIAEWTMNCAGGSPQYVFGTGSNGDCCQSHGDHDHISGLFLRYVGPESPATIQFETDGYSNTSYTGVHSFDEYVFIEAEDRFGTNSDMAYNGNWFEVHTSCSEPTNTGMGISSSGNFVSNPDPNASDIIFIIEGIATAEDGWCGSTSANCGTLDGVYIYDQSTDEPVYGPIQDNDQINITDLPNDYYLLALTSGNIGSTAWLVDGESLTENSIPFTFPSTGTNWNAGIGSYHVNLTAYLNEGATGEDCATLDFDFSIFQIECDVVATVSTTSNSVCDGTPNPPNTGDYDDCCQSHGDHDHISGFLLRYVGPTSPANIDFYTTGYGTTTYNQTHSVNDVFLIEAADRFGANSEMAVNGDWINVHTSCSEPTNVGFGINSNGDFVSNPNAADANILFIIEGLATPLDGWCGAQDIPNTCNGTATVDVTSGTAPYSYLWSDGSTEESRNDLCAGDYQVTVTDTNGCSVIVDFTVENTEGVVEFELTTEASIICIGTPNIDDCDCDGYIYEFTVVYTGQSGIGGGAYDYHDNEYGYWAMTNGNTYTFNVSNSNHPGEYNDHNDPMMWTYENGSWIHHGTIHSSCSQNVIGETYGPFEVIGYTDAEGNTCGSHDGNSQNGCDGSIELSVTTGIAPFTFEWSNGATTQNIENVCPGIYSVTVSDANGCSSTNEVEVICAPNCEVECPADLTVDCESDYSPIATGYPTLNCIDNAGCVRDAGEFDFELQEWGGATAGWSFGSGWYVGTGCDPACGDIPNVFIDYTDFHTAYNTKLKSPMYDACCTDNAYLSFCMQQDLYGQEDVPGYLAVEYRINGGAWAQLAEYQNVFGETVNYNDTFEIPGAGGQQFEVRFRADGEGSTEFTMGGFGIDDVRVYGQSSGCSGPSDLEVDWTYTDSAAGTCPEVITRSFSSEYNGEEISCEQTITVIDEEAPIFNGTPDDATYTCAEGIAASFATAIDNCDDNVAVTQSDEIIGGDCSYMIERTFVATDACGNTASYTQTINITEDEPIVTVSSTNDNCTQGEGSITFEFEDSACRTGINLSIDGGANFTNVPDNSGSYTFSGVLAGLYDLQVKWGNGECFNDIEDVTIIDNNEIELEIKNLGNCIVDLYEWLEGGDEFVVELLPGGSIIVITHVGAMWRIVGDDWNIAEFDEQYTVEGCFDQVWNVAPDYCDPECELEVEIEGDPSLTVCEGEEITLTAVVSGETDCDEIIACYTMNNATTEAGCVGTQGTGIVWQRAAGCEGSHTIWASGGDMKLTEYADNTARITGTITNNGQVGIVDVVLYDKANDGNTWSASCYLNGISGSESYYTSFLGIITVDGTEYTVEEKVSEMHFIIAQGAGLDSNNYGVGGWSAGTWGGCTEWFSNLTPCEIPSLETVYAWSTGETTETITVTEAGTYSVTVTDCAGCVATDEVVVTINDLPEVTASATNPVCLEENGSITFTFADNASRSNIEFSIDGGLTYPLNVLDNSGSASINDLAAGTYNLYARWGNDECPVDLGSITLIANECASLGNFVWYDDDRDGVQDVGEEGVEGVTAELYICGETDPIASTDTDENGFYLFENLQPGDYYVVFDGETLPTDYVFSPQNNGDVALDSDADENGATACVELAPGEYNDTIDAGINNPTGSIGDYVWEDEDQDGVQDAGEAGVEGVTVELYICGETDPIASTETDENGFYLFPDLEPGVEYYVVFSNLSGDYTFTNANQGDDTLDSDADEDGATICYELGVDENYEDFDAGIYIPTNVGDYVWYDNDTDGIQDVDEDGVEDVVVTLVSAGDDGIFGTADDVVADTQTTDENGFYLFEDVLSGDYIIVFDPTTLPTDFVLTAQNEGGDDELDSDADPLSGATAPFTAVYGQDNDLSYDAGITPCPVPMLNGDEPMDMSINCDEPIPAVPMVTFSDFIYGEAAVEFSEVTNDLGCGSQIVRTWTATNECENTASVNQVITIIDTEGPVITFQTPDQTIECDEEVPEINVTFVDNCDNDLTVIVDNWVNVLECGYEYVKWCQATDDCGQSAEATVTITVLDTTDPVVISAPADVTLECDQPEPTDMPVFEDNCDELLDLSAISSIAQLDCGYQVQRTWTATDDCGNSTSVSQTITFVDTTPPFFDALPADYVVNCDNGSSDPEFAGMPEAGDNCDESVEVTYTDGDAGEDCPASFERTWRATDDCGNFIEFIQMISINDFAAPVLTTPADITIECDESTDPSNTGMASAEDDCSTPTVTYVDGPMMGDCPYTMERTWTAVDPCGNAATDVQIITIEDTIAPVASGVGVEMNINCDEDVPESEITFTDNCDTNIEVAVTTSLEPFGCLYKFYQTLTATDECGNETSITNIYTVIDEVDPVLFGVPADAMIDCESEVPSAIVFATDNCDDDVPVALTAVTNYFDCGYEIVRTWTATDDCDNTTSLSQTLTVEDLTAPEITCPADYIVNCDNGSSDPEFAGEPTVEDNCSEWTVAYTDGPASDECPAVFVRTWTATDVCGNASSCTQNITINDFAAPTITCPADVTIECTDSTDPSNTGMASAEDDCSTPTVTYVDGPMMGDCPYTMERTWFAEDPCGNEVSCVQTITIDDTVAPVLSGEDAETTVQCDVAINLIAPTATDNCDEDVEIVPSSVTIPGDCANEWTEVYTWTATDECGNTAVRTFIVNYEDTTAPELFGVPADATIDCEAEVPSAIVFATDNCDDDVPVALTAVTNYFDCGYEIVRTWTAIDNCGNSTAMSQTLTVEDLTAPEITCPADYIVNCDNGSSDPEFAGEPTVEDACSEWTVAYTDGPASDECPAVFVRTWTATDVCGNASSCTQNITINDFEEPTITCPADVTIECTDSIDPLHTGGLATAEDDCSTPTITYTDSAITGDCPYTLVRTWTAVDPCGNEVSCVQTITIDDTVAPVLSGEDEILDLECNVSPFVIAPEVSDNCDQDIELVFNIETIEGDCANQWTDIYTWTAIDECGNTTVRTLTFNFDDTQAPVFDNQLLDLTIECDLPIPLAVVTATDNCDEDVNVTMTEDEFELPCGSLIERTYAAVDACGNGVSFTQSITIVDTTAPAVMSAPADVTIECDQPEPTEQPVFEDNCDDNLEILAISGINNVTDCGYQIERTWTAIDNCNNAVSVSQTITVVDTTAPVLESVPANVTIQCSDIPAVADVTATDNCDDAPDVVFSEVNTGGCPYTLVRTWTATDICGNTSAMSQTLTVIDDINPILVGVPADYSGECGFAPSPGSVTATDNCDEDVTVSMIEETVGNSCPLTIIRTWTAIDNCGNSVSDSQTITINDETAPVFTAGPADDTVECDMVMGPDFDAIEVEDNCDMNPEITFNEVIIPGEVLVDGAEPCGYEIVRTWTATDQCDNEATFVQTVTVVDTTDPVLMGVPADVTVECTDVPSAPTVSAMDNCFQGQMNVEFSESTATLDCGYEITRTWSVQDNCLNMATATQTITVTDTTVPEVVFTPANVTIECDEDLPTSNAAFTDACDDVLSMTVADVTVDQDCGYYIIRTWTAVDDCDNEASTSQTIFVTDSIDPELVGVPADATVQCSDIPSAPVVTATDNCDMNLVPTMVEEVISGECPYTIERTWTVSDECGNTASETQVLTVTDTIDPIVLSAPADVTIECDQPEPTEVPVFSDNCDNELELSAISSIAVNDCGYEINRTWFAMDDCGNETSVSQTITVVDTTAPVVVSSPADLDLECDEDIPFVAATFDDNCDQQVEVDFNEVIILLECENTYTIERTWTAMDDCGNMITATQTINVSDTTDPVIIGVPVNTIVECDAIPSAAEVTATDNCDLQVTVVFEESILETACEKEITRTWTATDNCGNTATATQVINVIDTVDPFAEFVPAMITVECDEEIQDASPIFSDNCDEMLDIVASEITEDLDCGSTITRSWTATDNCGNATTVSQTINVIDTEDPTVVSAPQDVTIQCDQPEPTDMPVFADNCDDDLEMTAQSSTAFDGCTTLITKTWTAIDDCENEVSVTQIITLIDTTDPELIGVPANVTAECDNVPAAADVTSTDNCTDNMEVFFAEGFEPMDCGYVLTRIWSATDNCGNTTSETQIVTVVDTVDPVVLTSPSDVTIECDQPEPTEVPVFSDNCDNELELSAISSIAVNDCGYEINRTWFATDDCGNTTSVSQTITVVDTTAPVIFNGPANVTVQCDAVPGNGTLDVEDNCDELVEIEVIDSTEDQDCGYIITRVYTATDDCGNSATHTQVITVTDTEAPAILGVPADVSIECGDAVPAPGDVEVEDNCDPMPMVTSSEMMEELECGYQIIRTYIATDECGNEATATQTITVGDFTAPVFDNTPEDITVNCDQVTIAPSLSATDNCDDLVEVTLEEVIGDGCPYTITRTWTATDECGNTATVVQIVTVIDEVAPVWDAFPLFIAVECDAIEDYTITATDNCGPVVVEIINELIFSGGCYGTLERTYEATDLCGNSITATQLVQIVDTTAPELFNVPAEVTIECGEDIPAIADDIFATDNCTDEVEIEFEEVQSNEFCPYTITRTWIASDICGNVTEGVQVINVTVEAPDQVALVSYPNPFNDKFTVEFSVPRDAEVIACIYDVTGREVMPIYKGEADARRLYSFQYNNVDWGAGTYILMVTVGDDVYHHKMIVTQK
jgi:hypothetical protein